MGIIIIDLQERKISKTEWKNYNHIHIRPDKTNFRSVRQSNMVCGIARFYRHLRVKYILLCVCVCVLVLVTLMNVSKNVFYSHYSPSSFFSFSRCVGFAQSFALYACVCVCVHILEAQTHTHVVSIENVVVQYNVNIREHQFQNQNDESKENHTYTQWLNTNFKSKNRPENRIV